MAENYSESIEEAMTKAFVRLSDIDPRRRTTFFLDILPRLDNVDFDMLPDTEKWLPPRYATELLL